MQFSIIILKLMFLSNLNRFGIFAMFVTAVPFIGQPISGFLFQKLGYICKFFLIVLEHKLLALLHRLFQFPLEWPHHFKLLLYST